MKKILLLGSGELGKEFVIAAMRAGQYVIACDRYDNAPAMQVADEREVFSMLDGEALEAVVKKHQPDIIVPEIEAIRTERLFKFEEQGIQVVPSARAVNFTMNRRAIRDLASKELGLRTLMMVRNVSVTYRDNYSMSLPGFMPNSQLFGQNNTTGLMAPGLDFAFGLTGDDYLRKAMNTFFCRTDRPVRFQGSINEDVSMYALAGLRGRLVLTLTSVMIVQMVTQTNEGGMTGTYLDGGTYLKSFYSVMAAPSCVRISMLHGGTRDTAQHWRIHHHVKWENCAAKVLSARWRKGK